MVGAFGRGEVSGPRLAFCVGRRYLLAGVGGRDVAVVVEKPDQVPAERLGGGDRVADLMLVEFSDRDLECSRCSFPSCLVRSRDRLPTGTAM